MIRLLSGLVFFAIISSVHAQEAAQDAKTFVVFVQEFEATCVSREAVQILVKSTHPKNKIRVWLDRIHMGVGTGDRSKTDLLPNADAEPLGCSRTLSGTQEWRIVRAEFIKQ
ncbi:MAG: hypothetical protein RL020_326 [Pseudomonadota bacterium]|jgi:hypothetical protein